MPKTKLTPENVIILRSLYKTGMNIMSLSLLFSISYEQTRRIVREERWKKVVVLQTKEDAEN
jgi:hypothetical protein